MRDQDYQNLATVALWAYRPVQANRLTPMFKGATLIDDATGFAPQHGTNLQAPNRHPDLDVIVSRVLLTIRPSEPLRYSLEWYLGDVGDAEPNVQIEMAGGLLPATGEVMILCDLPVLLRAGAFFDVALRLSREATASVCLTGNLAQLWEPEVEPEAEDDDHGGTVVPLPPPSSR